MVQRRERGTLSTADLNESDLATVIGVYPAIPHRREAPGGPGPSGPLGLLEDAPIPGRLSRLQEPFHGRTAGRRP